MHKDVFVCKDEISIAAGNRNRIPQKAGNMRKQFDELEIQAAAYLASHNHTQKEIAEFLSVSQPVVSRVVEQAREDGYLKETDPEFVRTNISEQRMQEIHARIAPRKLANKFNEFAIKNDLPFVPAVRIFPTPYTGLSKDTFTLRTEAFGRVAASYAAELLLRSRGCVGVSWGNTVANLVTGISASCRVAVRKASPIMFVPLCGEPLGLTGTHFSASTLAAKLDGVVNGGTSHSHSLAAVPALIPKTFPTDEIRIIRKLIGHVEAYKKIFTGSSRGNIHEKPLINGLDTILASVGAAETTMGWGHDELGRTAGFNRSDLKELIIGDISGVLIPKPKLRNADKKKLIRIEERWTGIGEDHIRNCVLRAKRDRTSGVIVSTIGRNKAAIVLECVKRGLINHLLADQDLADELVRLLG